MKKRYIILFGMALIFGFMSCKSTPKDSQTPSDSMADTTMVSDKNATVLEKAEAARQAALDAGADKIVPEQFNQTDALLEGLSKRSESGENVDSELEDVISRYQALESYAKAIAIKNRIDELGFQSYDKINYDKGTNALDSLAKLIEDENTTGSMLYDGANTAYIAFNSALINAFKARAKEERTAAFVAKRNADSVYAAVAQKEVYDGGVQSFRSGDTSYAQQDPENALKHFQESRNTFETLYADIADKRSAAQKAIDDAKAKVSETEQYAVQADKAAPLVGDNIKGIEDPNAVLLEAPTYDDPAKAAQDLPEDIVDMEAAK